MIERPQEKRDKKREIAMTHMVFVALGTLTAPRQREELLLPGQIG